MSLPARKLSRRTKPLPSPSLGDCPVGSEVLLPRVHDGDEGHEDGELYWEWARVLSHAEGRLVVEAKGVGPYHVRPRRLW